MTKTAATIDALPMLTTSQMIKQNQELLRWLDLPETRKITALTKRVIKALEGRGVALTDLQVRHVVVNHPRKASEGDGLCLYWAARDQLTEESLAEAEARFAEHSRLFPTSCAGEDLAPFRIADSDGEWNALCKIFEAKTLNACLGAWIQAALVPVVVSSRVRLPVAAYSDEGKALTSVASLLAGAHITGTWYHNHCFALPCGAWLGTIHDAECAELSHPLGRAPRVPLIDYIVDAIATTLATWVPVAVTWADDSGRVAA